MGEGVALARPSVKNRSTAFFSDFTELYGSESVILTQQMR